MKRHINSMTMERVREKRRAGQMILLETLESRTLLSASLALTIVPDTVVGDLGATFTATFSGLPAGQVPTGSVTILESAAAGSTTPIGTLAGAVAINGSGVATFTSTTPFTVGPHFFFASFAGDANVAAVNSPTSTLTVSPKVASTVTLSVSGDQTIGKVVHLSAQVTLADASVPTGPAQLKNVDTGEIIAPTGTAANGVTTFDLLLTTPTSHLVAMYAGDATHAAGQSDTLTVIAAKAPTTVNMVAGPYARTVTVNVGLPADFPDMLKPAFGGTVSLYEGTTLLGQVTLSGGTTSARFVLATLPVGSHVVHADFAGNELFANSAGDKTISIVKIPTTLKLSVINNGDALKVHFKLPGDVPPELLPLLSGTVTLYDGKKVVGTITVSGSGDIHYDTTSWRNGLHRIRAIYTGDSIFKSTITASLNFILTPHGSKVPPGIAHAKGLNNLGSSIGVIDPVSGEVTVAVVTKNGKAKGHNK